MERRNRKGKNPPDDDDGGGEKKRDSYCNKVTPVGTKTEERFQEVRADDEKQNQSSGRRPQPAVWVQSLRAFTQFLYAPFNGSVLPRCFTVRQCINLHKLLVFPLYIFFLYVYGGKQPFDFASKSYGPVALLLLICHSLYGLMWVFKDIHFGDHTWHTSMSPFGFIIVFIYPLATYYLPMFCLVSNQCPGGAFATGSEMWVIGLGVFCYTVGMFYHFGADTQKFYTLKHQRPRSLITEGFFAHSRNPNYFGEVMIYMAYGIWSCNYLCVPVFATVWIIMFLPNMLAKDASMSRYHQWQSWANRTGLIVPWLPALVQDLLFNGMRRTGRAKRTNTVDEFTSLL